MEAGQRPRRTSMAPARFRDTVVTKTLERVHQMKKAARLPYDLSALQWDSGHRQNTSHTYCYCGNYGSWFKSMVQVRNMIKIIFFKLVRLMCFAEYKKTSTFSQPPRPRHGNRGPSCDVTGAD